MTSSPKSDSIDRRARATFSIDLGDGVLGEAIFRPDLGETRFIVGRGDELRDEAFLEVKGRRVVPYSAQNNLLTHGVVLLASGIAEYESDGALLSDIQAHIHRYCDLSPEFEQLAAHYVLLTWVFDGFNELPYLRVRGEPGSGKTRFLLTVGHLCYKPIFASGASSVSPVFRMLDAVRGTLVMDESDFRMSDERAEIVKILNNGNAQGFPVLRSEATSRHEYEPRAYAVFGPKIVASRGFYEDRALESRFLTEDLGRSKLRADVPISLPPEMAVEATALRNKLLLFRFRNHGRRVVGEECIDPEVEPRLNQVFGPLLSIITDDSVRENLRGLVRRLNGQQIADRSLDVQSQMLEIIRELLAHRSGPIAVGDVARAFIARHGPEQEQRVSVKWVGYILRRKLLLRTRKSNGVFVIPPEERPALTQLFVRYGIAAPKPSQPSAA